MARGGWTRTRQAGKIDAGGPFRRQSRADHRRRNRYRLVHDVDLFVANQLGRVFPRDALGEHVAGVVERGDVETLGQVASGVPQTAVDRGIWHEADA